MAPVAVAAYVLAALLCATVAWTAVGGRQRGVWLAMAGVLMALALERWASPLGWVANAVRELAKAGSWYDDRRWLQKAAVFASTAVVAAGCAVLAWRMRRRPGVWPVLAGVGLLLAKAMIAAVSHHHVDVQFGRRLGPLSRHAWIEVAGLGFVAGWCGLLLIRGWWTARSGYAGILPMPRTGTGG